ncbi:hypothetical protein NNC19_16950 [Clostridium sp. SHJSY1]|uniref:hypothetical protein n=1 Tax=Clostridium sp. SHJSY1 TaxID=2942483 RepID=UPI002873F7AE|nr:hypothetical protein [Clostridium sp. SHJSY1]MDS0527381.1 hypothetical protein [Clostridium sp. SHJSY1]
MKIVFIAIILVLVLCNLFCFVKSRKYLKKVTGNDDESNRNYEEGTKYIKISVVISFLIFLVGATSVIVVKLL